MATAVYAERLVPDGTYTVVGSDGFHTTIDIQDAEWATKPSRDGRFPGKPKGTKSAGLLIGPNNSRDFQLYCFILPDGQLVPMSAAADRPMRALKALLTDKDPSRYGMEYASASGRCFRCGRKLTVPLSLHRGLGPDCAEIVGEWFDNMAAGKIDSLPIIPPAIRAPETVAVIHAPNGTAAPERATMEPDDVCTWNAQTKRLAIKLRWGCPGFDDKKTRVKGLGFRWADPTKTWERAFDAHYIETQGDELDRALAVLPSWKAVRADVLGLAEHAAATRAASKASNASFVPRGICDGMALRPFQAAGVQFMVERGSLVCADEMGLGKTPQSLAAVAHLGCTKALIIPPASLKLNWKREIRAWVKGARILTVDSGAPVSRGQLEWATVMIVNYENANPEKHPWLTTVAWDAIIADEAHYLKNPKAQRTANVKAITRAARNRGSLKLAIMLTGTPVLNRPIELYPLLELVGREDAVGGFWPFAHRYCQAHQENVGRRLVWKMDGASNLVELNDKLRTNGAFLRRVKDDVLKELPSKTWATVPVQMTAAGEALYQDAEDETIEWMYRQDDRLRALAVEATKEWDALSDDAHQRFAERSEGVDAGDRRPDLDDPATCERVRLKFVATYITGRKERSKAVAQLTQFEGLKTAAWKAKRENVLQWVDDFLGGSDRKLVIFAHHVAVVNELAERYGAPKIQGGMTMEAVEAGKATFQNDPECRVIVANIAAGGVGHTLTAASDVAFVEFPWTPALLDQAVDRVHRIGQDNAVTGWLLTAARDNDQPTIDGIICELLTAKRAVVNAATDGIEAADEASVADALAGRLLAGQGTFEARNEDRVTRKFFDDMA